MDIQKMQREEAQKANETELSQALLPLLKQPNDQELYLVQALMQALEELKQEPAYGGCGLGEEELDNMVELMDYPFSAMKPMQAYAQLTTWDESDPTEEEDLLDLLRDEAYELTEKRSALVRFAVKNLIGNRYDLSVEMP